MCNLVLRVLDIGIMTMFGYTFSRSISLRNFNVKYFHDSYQYQLYDMSRCFNHCISTNINLVSHPFIFIFIFIYEWEGGAGVTICDLSPRAWPDRGNPPLENVGLSHRYCDRGATDLTLAPQESQRMRHNAC